tara:strand:+ start:861 stop:1052 length:192 start_codon:yes stop_codon:yes gene_type:complete
MKKSQCKKIALKFYKRQFLKLVYQLGYNGAINRMETDYPFWNEFKFEIFQWYDFEILGVDYEY